MIEEDHAPPVPGPGPEFVPVHPHGRHRREGQRCEEQSLAPSRAPACFDIEMNSFSALPSIERSEANASSCSSLQAQAQLCQLP